MILINFCTEFHVLYLIKKIYLLRLLYQPLIFMSLIIIFGEKCDALSFDLLDTIVHRELYRFTLGLRLTFGHCEIQENYLHARTPADTSREGTEVREQAIKIEGK